MLSHPVYEVVHLFGIFLVFLALGGMVLHALGGGRREENPGRKLAGATHGIGLLLVLVGGFGMLARLDAGFPPWVVIKLVAWVLLGAVVALPYRSRGLARVAWFSVPFLGAVAVWAALWKPGA